MLKKNVNWLLSLSVVLVLVIATACGGDDPTPTPTATTAAAQPTATTAAAQPTATTAAAQPTATTAAAQPTATTAAAQPTRTRAPTAVPTPTEPPAMVKGIPGGVVNMSNNNQPSVEFLALGVFAAWIQVPPIYNQLVEYNPETAPLDDLRGDLATDWSVAADGVTYTFNMNKDARWHDGKPVTAEDARYSLVIQMETDQASLNDPALTEEMGGRSSSTSSAARFYYDSSRVIDTYTLEIKTKTPTAALLPLLAIETTGTVFPKHLLSAGVYSSFKDPKTIIGSGPFTMGKFVKDVSTVNIKNTDYFKEGRPFFDEIHHFVITEEPAVIAAFKAEQVLMGSAMVSNLSVKSSLQLVDEMGGKLGIHIGGPFWTTGIHMNARRAPFDDPMVRKAVHLMVYRQPIIEAFGGIHLIGTPVPPDYSWSFTTEEALTYPGIRELNGEKHPDDLAEAKRLMAEAGYGPGFEVEMTCYPVADGCDQAVLLQDQFRRFVGWDVTVRQIERAASRAIYDAGEYTIASGFNSFSFPDADASGLAIRKGSGMADLTTGYYNEKAEPLWDAIAAELDPDKRKALVTKVNAVLMEDSTFVNSYFTMAGWLVNNRIKNFNAGASVSAQRKHEHLWCDPKC